MISYFDWFIPNGTPEDMIRALEKLKEVEGVNDLKTGNIYSYKRKRNISEEGVYIRVAIGFTESMEVYEGIVNIYVKSLGFSINDEKVITEADKLLSQLARNRVLFSPNKCRKLLPVRHEP